MAGAVLPELVDLRDHFIRWPHCQQLSIRSQ
jgi:hypothetical protein